VAGHGLGRAVGPLTSKINSLESHESLKAGAGGETAVVGGAPDIAARFHVVNAPGPACQRTEKPGVLNGLLKVEAVFLLEAGD
jgi:hypothetical protein